MNILFQYKFNSHLSVMDTQMVEDALSGYMA